MENQRQLDRITLGRIGQYLMDIASFEKGLPYTIKELIWRPGYAIRQFLNVDREKLVKPLRFVIYLVAIGVIIKYYFIDDSLPELNTADKALNDAAQNAINFSQNHINLIMLINIPVVSIFSYFIYKKNGYNFAEHLLLNAYLVGMMNVLNIFGLLFIIFLGNDYNTSVNMGGLIIFLLYTLYFYYAFFRLPFTEILLRTVCIIVLAQLVGSSIDYLIVQYFYHASS